MVRDAHSPSAKTRTNGGRGAYMPVQILTQKDKEAYARLTAPQHIAVEHFSRHQKIEGYHENRDAPEFVGSDRLLKLDTLYGTIQMGYNPRRGQSFLFANIKTSVFDTAASRYQKELKEYQMARALKTGTQNLAYSAKRRGGAAVILYKAQNMPWSRGSIAPYLARANMEALRKTEYGRALYALRKETIEPVFGDAKERHAMRYTQHRSLPRVTAWVRLKFAAMNLKKLATWCWMTAFSFAFSPLRVLFRIENKRCLPHLWRHLFNLSKKGVSTDVGAPYLFGSAEQEEQRGKGA